MSDGRNLAGYLAEIEAAEPSGGAGAIRLAGVAVPTDEMSRCAMYTALYLARLGDAKAWMRAALMVGFVAAVAVAAAIVMVVIGQNGTATAAGVGTILTGAATGWLWAKRNEVQTQMDEFLAKSKDYCPNGGGSND